MTQFAQAAVPATGPATALATASGGFMGQSARLVPAGLVQKPDRTYVLRFTLLHEPADVDEYQLKNWPSYVHDSLSGGVSTRAVAVPAGALGSVYPASTAEPFTLTRVSAATNKSDVQRWWEAVLGGSVPLWSEMANTLRSGNAAAANDIPRIGNGCAALNTDARVLRATNAVRRLRGEAPSRRSSGPTVQEDRAAAGAGWGATPGEAIKQSMQRARSIGEADFEALAQWERERLNHPDRARGLLKKAEKSQLPRPDATKLFKIPGPQKFEGQSKTVRAARMRWGQLMNHPSLLRLFGLATDYELPSSALVDSSVFWLFQPVLARQPDAAGQVWTLAKLNRDHITRDPSSFWPCLRAEVDASQDLHDLSIRDGFANLRQPLTENLRQPLSENLQQPVSENLFRYQLTTTDALSHLVGHEVEAGGTEESPGLVLFDRMAPRDAIASDAFRATQLRSGIRIDDARQLQVGWQLDVRVGDKPDWHSLMGREIRYILPPGTPNAGNIETAIRGGYGNAYPMRRSLAESAMIDTPASLHERDGMQLLSHQELVAHWRGRPMGVPLIDEEVNGKRVMKVRQNELALTTREDLVGTIPPLRVGQRYSVRLRAVFVGGVVTDLRAAMPDADAGVLGPLAFLREEAIKPPIVLHLEDDLKRNAAPLQRPDGAGNAEDFFRLPGRAPLANAQELILRPALREGNEPEFTRRLFLPPLVPLALADRLTAVPSTGGQLRRGLPLMDFSSFANPAPNETSRRGGWPGVRIVGDSTMALERFGQSQGTSANRELVFRRAPLNAARAIDFLPDPHARLYRLALVWRSGGERVGESISLPVRGNAGFPSISYPNIRPLVLEVRPSHASDAATPRLEVVAAGTSLPFSPFGNDDRRALLVRLYLSGGEDVDVLAWCAPDPARHNEFQLWQELSDAHGEHFADRLFSKPDETVAGITRLRAAHAVAIPEQGLAPTLTPGLRPDWRDDKLVLNGRVRAKLRRLAGLRIDVTAAGLVAGRFDDPEHRGRSRADRAAGRWPLQLGNAALERPARDVFGFDVAGDGTVTLPQETATVLSFDGPPSQMQADAAAGGGLVLEGFAADWPGAIKDGRARLLTVTPKALPGAAALLVDRHGDQMPIGRLAGPSLQVWLEARKRPTPPLRPWVVPAFKWERGTRTEGSKVWTTLTRTTVPRIRLARPWFSSGEGEMLGIILWPPHLPKLSSEDVNRDHVRRRIIAPAEKENQPVHFEPPPSIDLSGLQDLDLGNASRFITRWGDDPIREPTGGFMPLLLARDKFVEAEKNGVWRFEMDVQVPLGGETGGTAIAEEPQEWLRACLLLTTPLFDPDLEEWHADLPVTLARSVEPFLRLGLVRWQAHAPPALRCSTPAVAWTQLPPTRTLLWRKEGTTVHAEIEGPHSRRADIPPNLGTPSNPHLQIPTMRFGLVQRESLADGGVSESPVGDCLTCGGGVTQSYSGVKWTAELNAAALPPGSSYHLFVEEVEERLAATPPPYTPGQTGRSHVTESGPRFAARVEVR